MYDQDAPSWSHDAIGQCFMFADMSNTGFHGWSALNGY